MKKTKLLSSICAFLFIFSLSSCNEVEETFDNSEESESSQSSLSSESFNEPQEDDLSFTSPNEILSYIQEDNNYTLTIEYHEVFSHYYSSVDEARNAYQNGTMELGGFTYFVNILFTNDAVLMEYYYSESTFNSGVPEDIELYVNGDSRTEVYYPDDDDNGELYHVGAYTQGIFQEVFYEYTLMPLITYSDYIVKGEESFGDYGLETEYLIDLEVTGIVPQLIYSLFHGYNLFVTSNQVYGPSDALYLYNHDLDYYEYHSKFYNEIETWYNALITSPIYWTNTSGYSWLEQDYMYSYVYNVGNTSLPSEYDKYL